jgi:hypothetical protein
MPDYEAMSGADFMRAVGDDPDKWAEAFLEAACSVTGKSKSERLAFVVGWFADAMEAARNATIRTVVEGDRT